MKPLSRICLRIAGVFFILQTIAACDKLQNIYESRNDAQLADAKHWPSKDALAGLNPVFEWKA